MYQKVPSAPAQGDINLGDSFITTTVDAVRSGVGVTVVAIPFGTACCAIEFMGTVSIDV